MDFTTIMKYLEQGFTLEQIEQMKTLNDKNSAQTGTDDKTPTIDENKSQLNDSAKSSATDSVDNAVPVWADSLTKQIEKLTHTIQAQALSSTSMNAPKSIDEEANDILANIINPTFPKKN